MIISNYSYGPLAFGGQLSIYFYLIFKNLNGDFTVIFFGNTMVLPTKINVFVPEILYKTRSIVHNSTAKDSYNDITCMQVMFGHVYIVSGHGFGF